MDFGIATTWIGLGSQQSYDLANALIQNARKITKIGANNNSEVEERKDI